ncbi:MAG: nitroreductase family protein, partial [Eggerthellaceae bacterium]|nr:nitroreductase family protein [Eggerthellaceae bacterium]
MEFQELIEQRYSVRKFKSDPLEESQLEAILEAGRLAPTARNLQPHRIWVATGEEALGKIDACSPCRFNAPAVLIVGYSDSATGRHPDPLH